MAESFEIERLSVTLTAAVRKALAPFEGRGIFL
jgi:hypothetical protein